MASKGPSVSAGVQRQAQSRPEAAGDQGNPGPLGPLDSSASIGAGG